MAKLADAKDLKSFSRQRECGFKSRPGHHSIIWLAARRRRGEPPISPAWPDGPQRSDWPNAQACALICSADTTTGFDIEVSNEFFGPSDGVRRKENVVEFVKRMSGRQRFLLEYVQTRAGDATLLKCGKERGLVHNGSPRSVDEISSGFMRAEFTAADQAFGLLIERSVDGQEIAFT